MPIYMKIDGVRGGIKGGKYDGWIELTSAQIGTHRNVKDPTGSNVNREASVPSISEIVVTKVQDDASATLFRLALADTGRHATIVFVKGNPPAPYLVIDLENTLFANYTVSGKGSDGKTPIESLTLNFTKITQQVTAHHDPTSQENGPDKVKWDLGGP
jgi:type VI secretion system secreted protein Hcp